MPPGELLLPASCPRKVLLFPVVTLWPASGPRAELLPPVVFAYRALIPRTKMNERPNRQH